jgi:succinate dehydrogenase / fumarate reductase, membrane anchor subunit
MAGYRTPLGRARGLGSAKHGVGHFIGQRVSAVALVFLAVWGVWSAWTLAGGGYDGASIWLQSPVNAALLALLAAVAFYHMQLGMRTIVEDYIHRPATKAVLLIANAFVCFGGAALTIVCVLKVAFGAGAA